jgi:hypothetical protein
MRKLPKYLIVFLALSIILFGAYFLVLYIFDGSTTAILHTYKITKDKDLVRNHLLEYRGEAESHGARINFVVWGLKNPGDFVEISEGVDISRKAQFCDLLAFAVTDSGVEKEFEATFEKYDSECMRAMRTEISENREWQQRLKTRLNQ